MLHPINIKSADDFRKKQQKINVLIGLLRKYISQNFSNSSFAKINEIYFGNNASLIIKTKNPVFGNELLLRQNILNNLLNCRIIIRY